MTATFPTADRNRLVKEASETLFRLAKPNNWHVETFGGDNDFGLDIHVQVSGEGGVQHAFYVQLKGTEHPDELADGSSLRYSLKRTTLNYYANLQSEVMLVLCVLSLDSSGGLDQSRSRVHWEWMSKVLNTQRGSEFDLDLSSTQTKTIHIPENQVLARDLDVSDHFQKRLERLRFAASLEEIVASNSVVFGHDSKAIMAQLAEGIRDKPEHLLAILLGASTASASLPEEAVEVRTLIRAGKTDAAELALEKVGRNGFGKAASSRAQWLCLRGKICMQRNLENEALQFFEEAYAIDSSEEFLLALSETHFLTAIDKEQLDEIERIRELLASVKSDDGLALLVRVLVALKDFQTAEAIVEQVSESRRLVPRLVLLSGIGEWERIIELALAATNIDVLSEVERTAVQLIAARAAWFRALQNIAVDLHKHETPLSGPLGTDLVFAQVAWNFSVQCAKGLRAVGWSRNIELLAPVMCAVAGVVGTQKDAIEILSEAAEARPTYYEVQHSIEMIAIGAGDAETALKANTHQVQTEETLIRRIGLLFQLHCHLDTVQGALEVANGNAVRGRNSAMALAMGYASAHKAANVGATDRLRSALQAHPDGSEYLPFAEFALSSLESAKSEICLDHLRAGLRSVPNSWFLTANLFTNLDVSDPGRAREAIALARVLRRRALLTQWESSHEVQAYLTLDRWQDASVAAQQALARFGEDQRILSLLAVAEEMLGRTGSAFAFLDRALRAGKDRVSILHNYMGIALRLGRIECVRLALDRLLVIEIDRVERLELLRLRALMHVQEREFGDASRLVAEVGRIVIREAEDEEGMFLNLFMAVRLSGPPDFDIEYPEFNLRVQRFSQIWPESKLFRVVPRSHDVSLGAHNLHCLLDPIVADSRKRIQESSERERQLQQGELPVPYVLRAGFAIHYIGNVFDLWAVAKISSSEDTQFHMNAALPSDSTDVRDPLREIPLLDLTTLLLLDSLGIFDRLFEIFSVIAVPSHTVGYISQHANSILAVGPGVSNARSVLASINKWINRIELPGTKRPGGGVIHPATVVSSYLELIRSGRWAMYCDDAILRQAIKNEGLFVVGLSTTDFLAVADGEGIMPPEEVASLLAQMVSWNVSINVTNRYLVASLMGVIELGSNKAAAERLSLFEQHEPFTRLFRALANPTKTPSDLVQHMGQLLVDVFTKDKNEVESISALSAFWLNRVRMFPVAGALGWRLLGYPIVFALSRLPDAAAGRIVGVMRSAVELCIGDCAATDSAEAEIPILLGDIAGGISRRDRKIGELIRGKLIIAMPMGTVDGDRWFSAYFQREGEHGESAPIGK